jgi:hypothetical protein
MIPTFFFVYFKLSKCTKNAKRKKRTKLLEFFLKKIRVE